MAESCSCSTAIVELHEFFAAWYRGDRDDIDLLEEALAPDFRLITPKGNLIERPAVVAAIRDQHGAHPASSIEIRPVTCTSVRGLHLSTYEEWQFDDADRPARLSTAVLSTADDRFTWHIVHETWLPDD